MRSVGPNAIKPSSGTASPRWHTTPRSHPSSWTAPKVGSSSMSRDAATSTASRLFGSTLSVTTSPSSTRRSEGNSTRWLTRRCSEAATASSSSLAEVLADVLPVESPHLLFASDGASAVEQALKIAFQYWVNRGTRTETRTLRSATRITATRSARLARRRRFRNGAVRSTALLGRAHPRIRRSGMAVQGHRHPGVSRWRPCRRGDRARCPRSIGHARGGHTRRRIVRALFRSRDSAHRRRGGNRLRSHHEIVRKRLVQPAPRSDVPRERDHRWVSADVCDGRIREGLRGIPGFDPGRRTFFHGHSYGGNALCASVALEHLRLIDRWDVLAQAASGAELLGRMLERRCTTPRSRRYPPIRPDGRCRPCL